MNRAPTSFAFPLVLAAVAALLLYRALMGGGPAYYFMSAVLFGMAYAALQSRRGPPKA
jgi:hypothetical protein